MKLNCDNVAYDKLYLTNVMNVHGLTFSKMDENEKYCVFSMIDRYMQCSDVRKKMDIGNWSALNKGYKQLLNSVDYEGCEPKQYSIDKISLHWIAEIYVLLQWKYNIPSSEISRKVPAKALFNLYNPLHETSHENACDKIYSKFLN